MFMYNGHIFQSATSALDYYIRKWEDINGQIDLESDDNTCDREIRSTVRMILKVLKRRKFKTRNLRQEQIGSKYKTYDRECDFDSMGTDSLLEVDPRKWIPTTDRKIL